MVGLKHLRTLDSSNYQCPLLETSSPQRKQIEQVSFKISNCSGEGKTQGGRDINHEEKVFLDPFHMWRLQQPYSEKID